MNLTLDNFQAWEHAEVKVEGLTVIVGPSNRGKSSFARALRGIFRNDVSERRIRRGTKATSVMAILGDTDLEVRRTGGTKGETTYRVGTEEFTKLGGKVPPPVEALNVAAVKVGDYTLDPIFARQFDGQFLLSSAPAEVTAVLNAFASTDKLDRGRRVLTSRTNDLNAEAKALGSLISQGEVDFAAADAQVTAATPSMDRVNYALSHVRALQRSLAALQALENLWEEREEAEKVLAATERLEACRTRAVAGFKVTTRARRAAIAMSEFQRLTQESAQVTTLEALRRSAVRAAEETSAAWTAVQADIAHRRFSQQAASVSALAPLRQSSVATEAQLTAAASLSQALQVGHALEAKTQSLETLRTYLNTALVSWKARVRATALMGLDVEGPKTLAAQIGDLRGGLVAPTKDLTALGIIWNLLRLKAQAEKIEDVGPELQALEAERADLNTQLDRQTVTCPKCHHQFNPKESAHGHC